MARAFMACAGALLCAAMAPHVAFAQGQVQLEGWTEPLSTQEAADEVGGVETDNAKPYVEGEIIVSFDEDAHAGDVVGAVFGIPQADARGTLDAMNLDSLGDAGASEPVVVKLDEGADEASAAREAERLPGVAAAQLNYRYQLLDDVRGVAQGALRAGVIAQDDDALTNDPALASYKPADDENAWHLSAIDIEYAWEQVKCNGAVTVAVLDTGCDMAHEDLRDNVLADYAYNAYKGESLNCDYYGHGTHVAGCIAATANNAVGTAGSSYNAKVLPINVFDAYGSDQWSSTTKALVAAYDYLFEFADAHPECNLHVVNMSLGGYGTASADDLALQQRIRQAKDRGIVSVCAGGNGTDGVPNTVSHYPSDYEECLAVTALSTDGETPTTWCDHNLAKDICVPGEDIYSTVPKYCKMEGNANWWVYEAASGTSMATPIASGVMALMWAARPDLTVDEAMAVVKDTASQRLVFPDNSWYMDRTVAEYGAGILDAGLAVEHVKALPPSDALRTALAEQARDAETVLSQTLESDDGTDVPASKQWAAPSVRRSLSQAAEQARDVAAVSMSYDEVVQARTALAQAREFFDSVLEYGSRAIAADEAKSELRRMARNAQIDMNGIVAADSADGLAAGTRWVEQDISERLVAAIASAQLLAKTEDAGVAEVASALDELVGARDAYNAAIKTVAPTSSADTPAASAPSATSSSSSASSSSASKTTTTASKPTTSASKPAAAKKKAVVINVATVNAKVVKKALKAANNTKATKVTLGSKVKKIAAKAFAGTKVKTVVVKTKKLTKKSVKNSLAKSKVAAVVVKVGKAKANKTYVKKYAKLFVKKVAGKKAKVKR